MTDTPKHQANAWLILAVCVLVASVAVVAIAQAQEHHSLGHSDYQNWRNGQGRGCCNNQDCGELPDANERTIAGQLEVRIEDQWCPVKPHHYLKKGNAPNWTSAHVCVEKASANEDGLADQRTPCERLLCYQPKPLF